MKGYNTKRKHYTVQKAVRPRMMQKLSPELSTAKARIERDNIVLNYKKQQEKFLLQTGGDQ